jgi:hypothetical protein
MKNFKPDKLVQQRRSDWLKLGGKLVTRIVGDSDKGISQDPDGRAFEKYSNDYSILKKAGKATPKGVSSSRQVSPPNLRASGEMLNSIKAQKATTDSVEIVYRSGLKVLGNANPPAKTKKPRRNIYGLNDKNWEFARNFIDDEIDQRILKFNLKKVFFDIKV